MKKVKVIIMSLFLICSLLVVPVPDVRAERMEEIMELTDLSWRIEPRLSSATDTIYFSMVVLSGDRVVQRTDALYWAFTGATVYEQGRPIQNGSSPIMTLPNGDQAWFGGLGGWTGLRLPRSGAGVGQQLSASGTYTYQDLPGTNGYTIEGFSFEFGFSLVTARNANLNINYTRPQKIDGSLVVKGPAVHYFPIVNGLVPTPATSASAGGRGYVTDVEALEFVGTLEEGVSWVELLDAPEIELGGSRIKQTRIAGNNGFLPVSGFFHLSEVDGTPMNDGNSVTGIGHSTWVQVATDFDGDSTEFGRKVTITTTSKPRAKLVYAGGALADTAFGDGSANGGLNGWSNYPLKAIISTDDGEGSHLVDGYYYNRLYDSEGEAVYGVDEKSLAEKQYSDETTETGIDVYGVMVDTSKTIELSESTAVTLKIDMTKPTIVISCDGGILNDDSYDNLSGIQHNRVAIVPAGSQEPEEIAYENIADWQSLVSGDGQYDIYVMLTDNAGNTATTVLHNKFLKAGTTSLGISKKVTGKYGDYNRAFEVTVSLKDDQGKPVDGEYTVSSNLVADYIVSFANGIGTVYIKDGENITITGLKVGYSYTVEETDITVGGDSPYIVSYNGTPSETGITGNLDGSAALVAIINNREYIPDMGIGENNTNFFIWSSLILLVFLMALTYCDKKRSYK